MTTVEEEGMKDGVWRLAPRKFLRAAPSRTSENALSEHKVSIAIIIDLYAQKEKWSNNLDMKDEQATLTLPFVALGL